MKKISLSILFIIFNFLSFSQDFDKEIKIIQNKLDSISQTQRNLLSEIEILKLQKLISDLKKNGLPAIISGEQITEHSAMILVYSEEYEQAKWVAHIISPDIITGNITRTNDFRADEKIQTGSAVTEDYWETGYDRGHLAPSADFRWSQIALSESYFYSNMSPQLPEFNREIWADIESFVRQKITEKNEPLYVVTGGILKKDLPTIGTNKVAIPEQFYKVVADLSGDSIAGIAFLVPNQKTDYPLTSFAVSIDSIEAVTGINFFASLPEKTQNSIESNFDIKIWQSSENIGNVAPIHRNKLPEKTINTVQARSYIDQKATVCGTVVSIKKTDKSGNIFINLDQDFPNQIFWCTIWESNIVNFSYNPEIYLKDKRICVTGDIKLKYGQPSMSIQNEKAIRLFEEMK